MSDRIIFQDLREFLSHLEAEGDVVRVAREVDQSVYEMSAILWELYSKPRSPVVVFENVKGYPGIPVVSNVFSVDRVGRLLGLPKDSGYKQVRQAYFDCLDSARWIEPRLVSDAPCKEVVLTGGDANLTRLPILKMQPEDGGAYITMGLVVTKDPKGTLGQNAGIYRMMLHGETSTGMIISILQDIGKHYARLTAVGKDRLEVAVAISCDPYSYLAAETKLRAREDEFAFAGALKGEPIDLVKCETVDLHVPASAEIVLEGEVSLDERKLEGPFAEWMGYYEEGHPAPVFNVKCITHRRDPLYQATTVAHGNSEGNFLFMFGQQYSFYQTIKEGATWIKDVHFPTEGRLFSAVVAIEKRYPFLGRQTIFKVLGAPPSSNYLNYVVVVDEDVDIYDPAEVSWAMSTKVDAERDVVIMPPLGVTGFNTAARQRVDLETEKMEMSICSKFGIDATSKTKAEGFMRGFVKPVRMPSETLKQVRRNWAEYGFRD